MFTFERNHIPKSHWATHRVSRRSKPRNLDKSFSLLCLLAAKIMFCFDIEFFRALNEILYLMPLVEQHKCFMLWCPYPWAERRLYQGGSGTCPGRWRCIDFRSLLLWILEELCSHIYVDLCSSHRVGIFKIIFWTGPKLYLFVENSICIHWKW